MTAMHVLWLHLVSGDADSPAAESDADDASDRSDQADSDGSAEPDDGA